MKTLHLAIGLFFISLVVHAQTKRTSFETTADVIWAGVDRPGDLSIVLQTGEVQKFDKDGKRIGSYKFKTPPTLFDPLDGVQAFYYSREQNQYGKLSSGLDVITEEHLDPAFAISPWLVSPSLHELWILDSSDFTIRKTKLNSTTISLEAALKHIPKKRIQDYTSMREYQNYLFLLDQNAGLHVFNALGKYVKTLGEKNLAYFNFLGEELYFMKDQEIRLVDLYTDEKRTLPIPMACRFALLTDERLFAVEARKVTIFEFKSN